MIKSEIETIKDEQEKLTEVEESKGKWSFKKALSESSFNCE